MSLPMFSHPWELLLNKIWWKSRRGMFEIFTPIFLFWQSRSGKIHSDTKKYISEWSSGCELYRGISVFIPKGWDLMKKWLRRHDENHEVLEPRFLSLPSCTRRILCRVSGLVSLCHVISRLIFIRFLKVGGVLEMIFFALLPGSGPNLLEDTVKKWQTFKVK